MPGPGWDVVLVPFFANPAPDSVCVKVLCGSTPIRYITVLRGKPTGATVQCASEPTVECCDISFCPVEMTTFSAAGGNERVYIRWHTESENMNSHFNLYRSNNRNSLGDRIAQVRGHDFSELPNDYEYIDTRVQNGVEYWYRICDVNYDGIETQYPSFVHATPSASAMGIIPKKYVLENNFPNPFNPSTEITYGIRESGHVQLFVYDISGREVTRLIDQYQEANTYRVQFHPENLPSGVYIYQLQTNGYSNAKRMIFMK